MTVLHEGEEKLGNGKEGDEREEDGGKGKQKIKKKCKTGRET
jgi:hypothetical protein